MKKGFTLIELLVVVGLMAMLGGISTVGYYAAVRGMKDRGVHDDVVSILRLAQQRALIDDVPVAVFVANKTVRAADSLGLENELVAGELTVVRMAGRLSFKEGNYIGDEFADWGANYTIQSGNKNGASDQTMPIYRLDPNANLSKSCSLVKSSVKGLSQNYLGGDQAMSASGLSVGKTVNQNVSFPILKNDGTGFNTTYFTTQFTSVPSYAFEITDGSSGNWTIGDPYGFEIARFQLPFGYLFSSSYKKEIGSQDVGSQPILFLPSEAAVSDGSSDSYLYMKGTSSLQIYAVRPGKTTPERIGNSIGSSSLKD